jgi:RNA polymerase sigma-70 factor (ECF subfamily)
MWKRPQAAEVQTPLAHGEDRARVFEAAVLLHLNAAYTLARYLTRRGDAAEDIVQEALLRAFRSFDSQRGDNTRAWLLAIVRNCFLTWQASRGKGEKEPLTLAPNDVVSEWEGESEKETPESLLIQHEQSSAVRALIEGLPDTFREVLVLKDIEDMSYREIADITGVPIGTVMSRLARARKMFAAAWKGSEMKAAKETQR